jgi:ABC-type antimicrobial peptide transport system permease subunit
MQPLSTLLVSILYQLMKEDGTRKHQISLSLTLPASAVLMIQSITGLGLGCLILSRKSLEKPKVKLFAHWKFFFEILALIIHAGLGGAMSEYTNLTIGIVLLLLTLFAAFTTWYISLKILFKDRTWTHVLRSLVTCSLLIAT